MANDESHSTEPTPDSPNSDKKVGKTGPRRVVKKSRVPVIALRIALSLLIMVLVAEAALWLVFRQGIEPAVRSEYWQDFPGLKHDIVYERNGLGLRTLSINSFDKPDNVVRILCLGASTTDQGTQNTEDMWAILLEKKLNEAITAEYPDTTVQIGTYARGGNKMHEVLQWANQRLERFEPDAVITLFGMNTQATEAMFMKQTSFTGLKNSLIDRPQPPGQRFLESYSQIYRYSRQVAENARQAAYLKKNGGLNFDIQGVPYFKQMYWQTPIDNTVPDLPDRTKLFSQMTDYFAGWLADRDIQQIILAQPILPHPGMEYSVNGDQVQLTGLDPRVATPESMARVKAELDAIWFTVNTGGSDGMRRMTPTHFRRDMDQFNAAQRAVAERRGVPFVPLDQILEPNLENFFDDCHYTDLGSERIAEAILPVALTMVSELLAEKN